MNTILVIFLILAIGYFLGSIKIFGLKLGTSGVLLVALIFGHFGYEIPVIIRDFGLVCFVTAVGFIAGPNFFRSFKSRALSFIALGVTIVIIGALLCVVSLFLFNIPTPLAIGIFSGAMTSTPGLAATIEATQSDMASIGYGIAYPFGVIGVVLFVQLLPKISHVNMKEELAIMSAELNDNNSEKKHGSKIWQTDSRGIFAFALTMCLGIIIGLISIPLPGGTSFSLGMAGGPLLAGLLSGHFRKIWRLSLHVPVKSLEIIREIGLFLFLMGAGVTAGKGFVDVILQYGFHLFIIGIIITLLPMILGYLIAVKALRLNKITSLAAICGGMTSTPALGALITTTESDIVVTAYAITYPISLVCVVLSSKLIALAF